MKATVKNRTDETTFTALDSKEFTIQVGEKAFDILLDGLYSNKVRAVVREICTNAADSHVSGGCADIPFDVHLPTALDSTFRVRDYGEGMSHDKVMTVYSQLFNSDKDKSNDNVGMLGLGSKSPFAYTDSFTLICRLDGRKRVYSIRRDENGIPRIDLLSDTVSDEAQGCEVSVPVRAEDRLDFATEARIVFLGFSPVPHFDAKLDLPTAIYFDTDHDFAVFNQRDLPGQSRVFIRQGCVIYPVDDTDLIESLTAIMKFSYGIVVDVPIGTADVAASREAISVDTDTRKNLETIFTTVADAVGKDVYDRCDRECKTMLDAQIFWYENKAASTANLHAVFNIAAKWNGESVYQTIDLSDILPRDKDGAKQYLKIKVGGSRNEEELKAVNFQNRGNVKVIYTTDDKVKRVTLRYRDFLKAQGRWNTSSIFYLTKPGKDVLAKLRKALGAEADQFIDIADLTDPGAPVRGGKDGLIAGAYRIVGSGTYKKLMAEDAPKKGGCWWKLVDRTTSGITYQIIDNYSNAVDILGLDERPIITVTASAKEKLKLDDADRLFDGITKAKAAKQAEVMEWVMQNSYNSKIHWGSALDSAEAEKLFSAYHDVPETSKFRRYYNGQEWEAAEERAAAKVKQLEEKYPLLFGKVDTEAVRWYIDNRDKETTQPKGTKLP